MLVDLMNEFGTRLGMVAVVVMIVRTRQGGGGRGGW